MPLYEYQCEVCGHRFETIQKFSDPPVQQCPKCGGAVQKLVASPAFQFKGSGWYITDYAKKDKNNGSGESKGAEGTKDQPAGAATAKDATKTETSTTTPAAASTDTAKKESKT